MRVSWSGGTNPAVANGGRLEWQPVGDAALSLGFDGEAPRFSALAEPATQPFAVMPLLAQMHEADAPLFAALMSLARWHSRHRFCARLRPCDRDHPRRLVAPCPACSADHFPRSTRS